MFGLFKKHKAESKLDSSQIVPRVKNIHFVEALKSAGVPDDQMPIIEPLVGELLVTYAFDVPDNFIMATKSHLSDLGIEPVALRGLALANVKRQIPRISLQQSGSVFRAATGNNMDACTLLARSIWEEQAERMKGCLIASVPNRDLVLFCDSTSADGFREMKELAQQAFEAGGTHALTLQLLQWSANGWQEYTD